MDSTKAPLLGKTLDELTQIVLVGEEPGTAERVL